MTPDSIEKKIAEFENQFRLYTFSRRLTDEELKHIDPEDLADEGGDPYTSAEPSDMEAWLRTALAEAESRGKLMGRGDMLEELQHEQVKLLDGFGHPKDCVSCLDAGDGKIDKLTEKQ